MKGKVVVFLQICTKLLAHLSKIDWVSPSRQLNRTIKPIRQIHQRQPARIVRPAVVGFKCGKENAGHWGTNSEKTAEEAKV